MIPWTSASSQRVLVRIASHCADGELYNLALVCSSFCAPAQIVLMGALTVRTHPTALDCAVELCCHEGIASYVTRLAFIGTRGDYNTTRNLHDVLQVLVHRPAVQTIHLGFLTWTKSPIHRTLALLRRIGGPSISLSSLVLEDVRVGSEVVFELPAVFHDLDTVELHDSEVLNTAMVWEDLITRFTERMPIRTPNSVVVAFPFQEGQATPETVTLRHMSAAVSDRRSTAYAQFVSVAQHLTMFGFRNLHIFSLRCYIMFISTLLGGFDSVLNAIGSCRSLRHLVLTFEPLAVPPESVFERSRLDTGFMADIVQALPRSISTLEVVVALVQIEPRNRSHVLTAIAWDLIVQQLESVHTSQLQIAVFAICSNFVLPPLVGDGMRWITANYFDVEFEQFSAQAPRVQSAHVVSSSRRHLFRYTADLTFVRHSRPSTQ